MSLPSGECAKTYAVPNHQFRVLIAVALLPAWAAQACSTSSARPTADSGASSEDSASGSIDPPLDDAGQPTDAGAVMPKDCKATAPTACTKPSPHFADVQPIFDMRCRSCHGVGNPDGNWPLNSYEHVADWNIEIRDQILKCTMPPPVAKIPITLAEREKILLWLRCGFPK